jgi:hypothetical protein
MKSGNTTSCGCLRGERAPAVGEVYGYLTVLEFIPSNTNKHSTWKCQCACGNTLAIRGCNLTSGNTNSCGCKRRKNATKHKNWRGVGKLSYRIWYSWINGANRRSIVFDLSPEDAWDLFLKQDGKCALTGVELTFAEGCWQHLHGKTTASLDRIDPNDCYHIGNVQWVHKDVNIMKRTLSQEAFIDICIKVANLHKAA